MAREYCCQIQYHAKITAKRDLVGRSTGSGDHYFIRKSRSRLRAESRELREQGARSALFDAAPHARGDRGHRDGLALVHRARIDRRIGHGDHRDRHCLLG